jgi:transcriptional regulator with XRE-family HTH domain
MTEHTLPIAQRIRTVRERRGLSQDEVEKSLGLSPNQISKYERGVVLPNSKALVQLCRYFEVSADYLLGLSSHPEEHFLRDSLTADEEQVLRAYDSNDLPKLLSLISDLASRTG